MRKELQILLDFVMSEQIIHDLLDATEDFDNSVFLATIFTAIEKRFNFEIDGLHDKLLDVVIFLKESGVDMENTN